MSDTATHSDISDEERLCRLQLALSDNIGPATYHQLLELYGSGSEAIAALPDLASGAIRGRRVGLYSRDRARQHIERTHACGGQIITIGEPGFPDLLAQTVNPPPILFAAGNTDLLQQTTCAIVGSRNSSANGKRFARDVATGLAQAGWKVASGLARGIDTAAHEASLEYGTVAVIATGLDVIYPPENSALQARIHSDGCVVTEMPPGTKPRAELFPRRNRIIAGLAAGVVVIEAAMRSGSLITARLANEIGRDVFAVPGSPFDPRSEGTNKLIQDGAMLITSARDVLDVLERGHLYTSSAGGDVQPQRPIVSGASKHTADNEPHPHAMSRDSQMVDDTHRQAVMDLLGPDPVEVDVVVRESELSSRLVQMVMMELDLTGRLERHPGQRVSLIV
ncbi:DNA-processing protein DprA [Anderseniella sp. Alg231-50]|uniref:DNA-processing protein DprA n=1 Tax=Anderseniella sp. Alg231-50 TaxID=1922226 RepID=UPI000D559EA6